MGNSSQVQKYSSSPLPPAERGKAQFKIPHEWTDGKAGIPSNIPPHTDFTLKIHRIETKQQEKSRETQIQVEVGLHINHNQEPREKMKTQKLSDQELLNIIIGTVKGPTKQLESPPDQQDQCQQATQLHSESFLDQGQYTKQKT